jgi:hypothetical protein
VFSLGTQDYAKLMSGTGVLESISTADWTVQTIAAWRHCIWMGIRDPLAWVPKCGLNARLWWKTLKDAWCLERMHQAFAAGLMQYGMMKATKAKGWEAEADAADAAAEAKAEGDAPIAGPVTGPWPNAEGDAPVAGPVQGGWPKK